MAFRQTVASEAALIPLFLGKQKCNVTFVVDSSESMRPVLGSVKQLLIQTLLNKALLRDSLFNIITFSGKVRLDDITTPTSDIMHTERILHLRRQGKMSMVTLEVVLFIISNLFGQGASRKERVCHLGSIIKIPSQFDHLISMLRQKYCPNGVAIKKVMGSPKHRILSL